jgi:arylsulfatase A-like enzyme
MNIVLITIDCLRADHLSCMGYERQTSPFMDSLAERGMLFTQAIINGVGTFASFPALMTSTYPFMHGGYEKINRKTIAEVLQRKGYVTAGFNDNSFLSPYFGYNRGFNYFDCLSLRKEKALSNKVMDRGKRIVSKNACILKFATMMYSILPKSVSMGGKSINSEVLSWLRKNCTTNFFLWIHYMDVHSAHYAPKEYFRKIGLQPPSRSELISLNSKLGSNASKLYKNGKINEREIELLKATYDAEVRYVDERIREIFGGLASLGIDKNTVMIITGDHGEEFFEHGSYHSHENFYDEMLHVPLIIHGAGLPCRRVDGQVQEIDIAPTILDLLGEVREEGFIGKSLLTNNVESEYVIAEVAHDYIADPETQRIIQIDFNLRKTAIRFVKGNSKWKYISSTKENKEELYNLADDALEKNNLMGRKGREVKEILDRFRERLKSHFKLEEEQRRIKQKIGRLRNGCYL